MMGITNAIYAEIAGITPYDELESQHIAATLAWIQSGEQIFRVAKPATPPKHLVSYFVLYDENAKKLLLVDHKDAMLWLPTGGHVNIDEHPRDAAKRECMEELGISAEFWRAEPLLLTTTVTVGHSAGHTDVSLWYVMRGDHSAEYDYDNNEFSRVRWFGFDEIPYERCDRHMRRFVGKLITVNE